MAERRLSDDDRIAVRMQLGRDHDLFTDEEIDSAAAAFLGKPNAVLVARRLRSTKRARREVR